MTAEIGIFNRSAVALAADSAVSIGSSKVYDTADKLFSLSKIHPIGLMVYNGASFAQLPWETIVKQFRKELGFKEYSTIRHYRDALLEFLSEDRFQDIVVEQVEILQESISFAGAIAQDANDRYFKKLREGIVLTDGQCKDDLLELLQEELEKAVSFKYLEGFGASDVADVKSAYSADFERAIRNVFKERPIALPKMDGEIVERFAELSSEMICRRYGFSVQSGIVIAGFGRDEMMPSMEWIQIEGFVNGKTRYFVEKSVNMARNNEPAIIQPFAQQEMVKRFIDGVEPSYDTFVDRLLERLLTGFVETLAKDFGSVDPKFKVILEKALSSGNIIEQTCRNFRGACEKFKGDEFSDPILAMVKFLPKDELGNMAEALVSLTALKRKVSPEHPSVGGPIDVAIISKGDGFIWYRRKHYFDPKLNPHFCNTYFKTLKGEDNE